MISQQSLPKELDPFIWLGMEFEERSGDQYITVCPLCGKAEHFYICGETTLWDCKHCGKSGNMFTFLKEYTDVINNDTSNKEWERLSSNRRMPIVDLKRYKIGFDGEYWLIPCYYENGTVKDVMRWNLNSPHI